MHFFFNVRDGRTIPDDIGLELSGLREAQIRALRRASFLLQDDVSFWEGHEWTMNVTDDSGQTLFTLSFSVRDLDALLKVKPVPAHG